MTTSTASPISAEPLGGVRGHRHCWGASQASLGHLTATATPKWDISTPRMGLHMPWTLNCVWVSQGKPLAGAHWAGGENQGAVPSL